MPPPTCDTETEYVAPADPVQLRVGVSVVTVVPGCEDPPGVKPVGAGGTVVTFTVKYTTADAALDPAEFEADTSHMYVAPFCSVGQTTEVVVTFCDSTMPPPTLDTETEYVAPEDPVQLRVGVSVVTVMPGCEDPPGVKPVGVGGTVDAVITFSVTGADSCWSGLITTKSKTPGPRVRGTMI
jgi:hypothetical protein